MSIQTTGRLDIPTDNVRAVALSVTAIPQSGSGYLTIWGGDEESEPTPTSSLNFADGRVSSNLVVAGLGAGGAVTVVNHSSSPVHLIVDAQGWYLGLASPFERAIDRALSTRTPTTQKAAADSDQPAPLSDSEIRNALTALGATEIELTDGYTMDDGSTEGGQVRAAGFDRDLFSVRGSWADFIIDQRVYIAFYGRWNYKAGFIGSGDPYDAAGIVVGGFPGRCWTNTKAGVRTLDTSGDKTPNWSRFQGKHQSTTWNIHDDTRGFEMLTDQGFAFHEMRRDALGCTARKTGQFIHEHNQEGNGSITIGIAFRLLEVSYNGSPGDTLQKGTKIRYFDYQEGTPNA